MAPGVEGILVLVTCGQLCGLSFFKTASWVRGQDCCHPGGDSILGSPGLETASWILEAASWVGIVRVALDSFLEFGADPLSLGEPRFW